MNVKRMQFAFHLRLARGTGDAKVTQGPVRSVDSFTVRILVESSITFSQRVSSPPNPAFFALRRPKEPGTSIESGWVSVAPPSVQIELHPDESGHKWKVVQLRGALQLDL